MWKNEVSIDIAAVPEKVFRYLADFSRHAEWSMSVAQIEQVTPGPPGVGTEFKASETLPQELTTFARITALEPPTRIAWESTDHHVFRTNWEFEIRPNADGTHLTQRVTFNTLSSAAEPILLMRQTQVPPENLKSLGRIKQILEK